MKPRRLLLLVCLTTAVASPALAHDVDGKWGIGFEETLTAVGSRQVVPISDGLTGNTTAAQPDIRASGLCGRWWFGNVGLEAVAGFAIHLPSIKAAKEFGAFLSAGVLYNVVRAPQVNLTIGLRVLGGVGSTNASNVSTGTRLGMAFEIPIRAEYFFNQQFAIAGAFGPTLAYNGDRTNPLTGSSASLDIALARGDFGGGLGFTYYIR